jgi:hypothetical protein
MNTKDPNSPEAIAFHEREWQHRVKQANVTLAQACRCDNLWDGLYNWFWVNPNAVINAIGAENCQLFLNLVTTAPLLREEMAKTLVKARAEML